MPIIFNNNAKELISSLVVEEERPERRSINKHWLTKKQKEFLESLGYIVKNGDFKYTRTSSKRRQHRQA